jgi:hypothetical protein
MVSGHYTTKHKKSTISNFQTVGQFSIYISKILLNSFEAVMVCTLRLYKNFEREYSGLFWSKATCIKQLVIEPVLLVFNILYIAQQRFQF